MSHFCFCYAAIRLIRLAPSNDPFSYRKLFLTFLFSIRLFNYVDQRIALAQASQSQEERATCLARKAAYSTSLRSSLKNAQRSRMNAQPAATASAFRASKTHHQSLLHNTRNAAAAVKSRAVETLDCRRARQSRDAAATASARAAETPPVDLRMLSALPGRGQLKHSTAGAHVNPLTLLQQNARQSRYAAVTARSREPVRVLQRSTRNPAMLQRLLLPETPRANRQGNNSFQMTSFGIVIDADKRPHDEYERRYNAPACNEMATIIHGQQQRTRDIVLKSRGGALRRISETHRSYDALQYPLLFPYGDDGYHFGIPLHTPGGQPTTSSKALPCNAFYLYRLMVSDGDFNLLHRCRELFHQFAVDMVAKMESERLCFIQNHQKQLCSDSYVHLRDSLRNEVNPGDLEKLCFLPSTYTGGPRYIHGGT
ncbi:unnamed protein product [Acanthosepion pharaonis]|uniref:Helitron helicase-like domain-containing protein n=1 Tax=Acanthosepion pharaonis TaxID=158019 RepID=A0A812C149_ACAPH|nr:unnamed protein product [Sepia pharaonis]